MRMPIEEFMSDPDLIVKSRVPPHRPMRCLTRLELAFIAGLVSLATGLLIRLASRWLATKSTYQETRYTTDYRFDPVANENWKSIGYWVALGGAVILAICLNRWLQKDSGQSKPSPTPHER